MDHVPPVSLVILTYNRPALVRIQLENLQQINYRPFEVIVVDNHSEQPLDDIVNRFSFARLIRMQENLGVAGRNRGIEAALGEIVITLDDDVTGITDTDINRLISLFRDPEIGAICFKVLDEQTGEIVNWCHHRKQEVYSDLQFITDEITEGAVAFRRNVVIQAGLYPEQFFISHEGPDLALRIMNTGYNVIYTPEITVRHSHATAGRPGWRRYYYDTRNLIWLVLRNYPLSTGTRMLLIGLSAMLVYSVRDGFLRYWLKGMADAVRSTPEILKQRVPANARTLTILREIKAYRPGFWYMVRKRLLKKRVRI